MYLLDMKIHVEDRGDKVWHPEGSRLRWGHGEILAGDAIRVLSELPLGFGLQVAVAVGKEVRKVG